MRIARLRCRIAALICAACLQPVMPVQAQGQPTIKESPFQGPRVLPPSPATCPAGYIVGGTFVPKPPAPTTTAPKGPTPTVPGAPSPPAKPTHPAFKPVLPIAQIPRITNLAWNFTDNILEIVGTDFADSYAPRDGEPMRPTTPRLFINGSIDATSQPAGGFFIRAPSVRQSGCYQFVVQRRVPKQVVNQAGQVVTTEALGPQSQPYQEFVFVPKRVVLTSVRLVSSDADHPLTYELQGTDIGRLDAQTQIWASAQPNQRFPDGSPAQVMSLAQVQIKDQDTIQVSNELVQGDTVHSISFSDPHYGMLQSNNVQASFPRRLIIQQVVPTDTGYFLKGPNFGSDLTQLRVLENISQIPQQNLSLLVITGQNSNTFQVKVNSPVTGSVVHQVVSLTPGIGASRRVSFTHPPFPVISGIQMTSYGFDITGSNLGNDPNTAVLLLLTGSTGFGISAGQPQFNLSYLHQVSDSRIGVNYGSGCLTLPLLHNVPTQIKVTAPVQGSPRQSQPFLFTFPQTWAQFTPVITSVTKTSDGLQIGGTSLGQAQEACLISVLSQAQGGASQVVSGSLNLSDVLSVSDTLVRVRMTPVPSGQRAVTVFRAGMMSQPFSVNLGP